MYDIKANVKPGQSKDFQFKLFIFIILTIITFIILIIFIAYIQILKNFSYKTKSARNREKIIRISPIRGKIYSNDEKLLAYNITSFNIYITPIELSKDNSKRQEELFFLCDSLNLNYNELENQLAQLKNLKEEFLISENLPLEAFVKIKENLDQLPGVSYKETLYRIYPNKALLSHVLGHLGPISSGELNINKNLGYDRSDYIGKNGLEKYYEDDLRGKPGEKVYLVDATMTIIRELKEKERQPEPGNELVLSINLELQKNVEDILADRTGSIIVIKPSNGEILAMASYPDYDPNIYILSTKENNSKKRELLLNTIDTPLINRNIQSVYPSASIFKLVTSTAVLNENILPATKKFYCDGSFWIGKNYKCWVLSGHNWQNLYDGITNSCDVYFYNAGLATGPVRINKYAIAYGFGSLVGIDLPYEKEGLIPSPEWMKSKGELWQDGHTLNMTIGQGDVKVTPLQIANLMSVICNKGYSYKPHILKEIRSSMNGSLIKKNEPEKIIKLNYDESIFNFIHETLRNVNVNGTGKWGFYSNPFKIAGKTGTAEIGTTDNKQTHSWYAGYGPIDYPLSEQIVVVVLIEFENHKPFKFAASIASMVFNSWLNNENFEETAKRLWYPIKKSYNE